MGWSLAVMMVIIMTMVMVVVVVVVVVMFAMLMTMLMCVSIGGFSINFGLAFATPAYSTHLVYLHIFYAQFIATGDLHLIAATMGTGIKSHLDINIL